MIERRHTNRRDFFEENVPPDVIYELTTAAEQEEAALVQIVDPEQKIIAAQLSQEAEAIQRADDRYRAELEAWTTTDLHRRDGVPVYAIPHRPMSVPSLGLGSQLRRCRIGMAAKVLMRIGQAAPTPSSKRRDPTMIISETGD